MNVRGPKIIVFDFDGTLADTLEHIFQLYNQIAPSFGCQTVDPAERERFRDQRPAEFMASLGISMWKVPLMNLKIRAGLRDIVPGIDINPAIADVLRLFKARGDVLGIVTSNSEENIRLFLENNRLADVFSFVDDDRSVFGKHRNLAKLIRENGYDPARVVYIGDETRDIEAARKAGVASIAVAWGFNTRERLAASRPGRLAERPEDLPAAVDSL